MDGRAIVHGRLDLEHYRKKITKMYAFQDFYGPAVDVLITHLS